MPNDDPAFATIEELARRLRGGETTSVGLTRHFLKRLGEIGPGLNCVVNLTPERALREAERADSELNEGRDRGPLHGIPYGAKDLIAALGAPTTWGCPPFRDRTFDRDATVVRKLEEAGAVLIGKLSTVECAGGLGYRQADASLTGPGLNPWDPTRWSGGSSSGPGSAVAAGLVPFAIGSETWGSIICPSAYCGISGLRPTYGRVSRAGAMALSYTLDKIGPMARSARDCALVLRAIAGADPDDPSAADRPFPLSDADSLGRPFKVAILKGAVDGSQREVRENYLRAIEVIRGFATIEEIEPPDFPFGLLTKTILDAEEASALEELVDSGAVEGMTAPEDRIGGYAPHAILATEYLRAQRLRGRACRIFDDWLAPFDAVVTAAEPDGAPPIGRDFANAFASRSLGAPGNLCGTPALAIPSGFADDGLPTAIQFDGRAWSEGRLVALAIAYQGATSHHLSRPKLDG